MLLYTGKAAPLTSKLERRLEIFNEFIVGMCILSLMPLTDWNQEADIKFYYSWILISLMQILIIINMLVVFGSSYHSICLLYKKYKLKYLDKIYEKYYKK